MNVLLILIILGFLIYAVLGIVHYTGTTIKVLSIICGRKKIDFDTKNLTTIQICKIYRETFYKTGIPFGILCPIVLWLLDSFLHHKPIIINSITILFYLLLGLISGLFFGAEFAQKVVERKLK